MVTTLGVPGRVIEIRVLGVPPYKKSYKLKMVLKLAHLISSSVVCSPIAEARTWQASLPGHGRRRRVASQQVVPLEHSGERRIPLRGSTDLVAFSIRADWSLGRSRLQPHQTSKNPSVGEQPLYCHGPAIGMSAERGKSVSTDSVCSCSGWRL